jgi:hypothetical protein
LTCHLKNKLESNQALLHALQQDVLGQVDADEYHFAETLFTLGPGWTQIAAHQLVYTLENHLAIGAFHVQHAFVTQHARAINIDNGAQKVLQFGRVKGPLRPEDKALDIIIMVMVMPCAVVMAV